MRVAPIILSSILVFISGCVMKPAVTEVVSPQYNQMLYIGEHRFVVRDSNEKYKIIDSNNNSLSESYEYLTDIHGSPWLYALDKDKDKSVFVVKKDDKYGIITAKGEPIVPVSYDSVYCSEISGDVVKLRGEETEYYDFKKRIYLPVESVKIGRNGKYVIEKNEKYSVVDKNGNTILTSDRTIADVTDETIIIAKKKSEHHIKNGAIIINPDELLFGIENFNGEKIYDYSNATIEPVSDGYICQKVGKELLYGYIDLNGNEILPFEYMNISKVGDFIVAYRKVNLHDIKNFYQMGEITYIDENNTVHSPEKGYNIYEVDDYPCLKLDNGVILFKNGKEILFKNIDEVHSVGNKYSTVSYNGTKYITDGKKQYTFEEYDDFLTVDDYLLFKKDGLWGICHIGDLS